jgi:hypothetical protein
MVSSMEPARAASLEFQRQPASRIGPPQSLGVRPLFHFHKGIVVKGVKFAAFAATGHSLPVRIVVESFPAGGAYSRVEDLACGGTSDHDLEQNGHFKIPPAENDRLQILVP